MRLCRLPQTASVVFALGAAALSGQSTPSSSTQVVTAAAHNPAAPGPAAGNEPADTSSAPAGTKAPSAASRVLFFYTAARSTVEMEVHTVPPTNEARLDRLRAAFQAAKCGGNLMQEQPVSAKHGAPGTNLVCTWPGSGGGGTIVVAAHYDHEGNGEGALDDWSGAALLPFLYEALQGQPRENTFVFLEAWKGDGVQTWLKSLSKDQRKNIRGMIDVDALGLGITRYFTTFSFGETPPVAATHMQMELLWAAIDNGLTRPPLETSPHHWLTVDATDAFRAMMIPTIVLHSVPPESDRVPGSTADVASAVDGNAYFQSYQLICTYLASLDRMAKRLAAANDPFWKLPPSNKDVRPADETPQVTFRTAIGGHLMPGPPGSH